MTAPTTLRTAVDAAHEVLSRGEGSPFRRVVVAQRIDVKPGEQMVGTVQGAASVTMLLNLIALWKQEPRNSLRAKTPPAREPFRAVGAAAEQVGGVDAGTLRIQMRQVPVVMVVDGTAVSGPALLIGLADLVVQAGLR